MKKRAYRRRQYRLRTTYWIKRLRNEEVGFYDFLITQESRRERDESILYRAKFYANTACNCSCWMCGNPRRTFGEITPQEKRSNINFRQQLEEYVSIQRLKRNDPTPFHLKKEK